MNNLFILSDNSLRLMGEQLNFSGTFNHTCRSPYNRHTVQIGMKVERGINDTQVTITMGGEKHSITLETGAAGNANTLADFIDAIANGRVDSAEPAPPRILREIHAPTSRLDTDQQQAIRNLVRHGGYLELHVGLEHPIRVMVHRTRSTTGITAMLSIGERMPRTTSFTIRRERDAYCAKCLQESVEHLIVTATPKAARAA